MDTLSTAVPIVVNLNLYLFLVKAVSAHLVVTCIIRNGLYGLFVCPASSFPVTTDTVCLRFQRNFASSFLRIILF